MENSNARFQRCHGNGEAYKTYATLEPKFTKEFNKLTLELLTEVYLRKELDVSKNVLLEDRDYVHLRNTWRSVAEELKVLEKYPYDMEQFPHSHPMAREAVLNAQKAIKEAQ